jgi:hypothetical protein
VILTLTDCNGIIRARLTLLAVLGSEDLRAIWARSADAAAYGGVLTLEVL